MSVQNKIWQRKLLNEKPGAFYTTTESFEQILFSLILLRKINENSICSKYYLAASAAKGRPPAFLHNPIRYPALRLKGSDRNAWPRGYARQHAGQQQAHSIPIDNQCASPYF